MKFVALRATSVTFAVGVLAASGLLSGCNGALVGTASGVPVQTPLGTIQGSLHGGRQPVVGAAVYVYQAGTTGYGSASTSLLTNYATGNYPTTLDTNGNYYVTTDGNGYFGLSGEYTCTVGNEVYLYSVGGNTGGGVGTTNPSAGFLAVLGQCPASGSMASVTPSVNMNEASTIAAAYALAGFAVDALHIGVPTSTTPALATLEQVNLANAFATAGNIYNVGVAGVVSSFPTYTTGTGTQSPNSTITAYSISGGVATFTCANSYAAGQSLVLSGFPTSTFLNGQAVTVLSTGLSGTQFQANVTGSTASITKYADTTTVATFTAANTFFVGENVILSGFPSTAPSSTTPFNGQTVTVATGVSTTKFTANFANAATVSTTTLTTAALATMVTSTITESGVASLPTGTLPTTKLNSLANSLAACVNSTGSGSTACTDVLGTASDTASAAILIAKSPAANVSNVFNAAPSTGNPYNNALTAAPYDWTISIIYSGGGLTATGTSCCALGPHDVGIDGSGNVWTISNSSPFTLSGFSNQGVPLSGTGFTNSAVLYPSGAVLDAASQNVFIADEANAADTLVNDTLNEYNIATSTWTTITPVSGTTAELSEPIDLTFDGAGNIWVANIGTQELAKLTPSTTTPYTYTYSTETTNTSYVTTYYGVAAEPGAAGNIWLAGAAASGKMYVDLFTNADVFSTDVIADYRYGYAAAVDASGNAWVANEEVAVSKIPAAGGTGANYAYPTEHTAGAVLNIALDGAGNAWLPDINNGLIYEYNNSGTLISAPYGYMPNEGTIAPWTPPAASTSGFVVPAYIAIDGSGNAWIKPYGTKTLQEMVGVAVPVVTPLAYGTANNLLGQMP